MRKNQEKFLAGWLLLLLVSLMGCSLNRALGEEWKPKSDGALRWSVQLGPDANAPKMNMVLDASKGLAGIYDTLWADLNRNGRLDDEKPTTGTGERPVEDGLTFSPVTVTAPFRDVDPHAHYTLRFFRTGSYTDFGSGILIGSELDVKSGKDDWKFNYPGYFTRDPQKEETHSIELGTSVTLNLFARAQKVVVAKEGQAIAKQDTPGLMVVIRLKDPLDANIAALPYWIDTSHPGGKFPKGIESIQCNGKYSVPRLVVTSPSGIVSEYNTTKEPPTWSQYATYSIPVLERGEYTVEVTLNVGPYCPEGVLKATKKVQVSDADFK